MILNTTLATLMLFQAGAQKKADLPVETDAARKPMVVTKGDCLIKGGTLITITNGTMKGDLLVRGGKIVALGSNLSAPAGVKVIDATSKYVAPGIIDAHSHMAATAINEWTESAVPEVRIADVIDPESPSFYYKLASGFTSSLVLHGSSNPIGGESQIIKLKWKRPINEVLFPGAPRIVKFALGENVKRSNSSQPQTRFPATRMGVEAVYRRAFTAAQDYMAETERYRANPVGPAPRKDLRLEALANILRQEILVHCHAYRQDEMLMLVRLSKEFGFKLMAFTHGLEAYKIAPELAAAGIGASMFSDAWSYKVEVFDAIPYSAALTWRAGVLTSINTDTFSGMTPLYMDSAKTMRFGGVPADEAMKMVTINPAKQLGIEGRVGSLEQGKDADIGIYSGHPLSVYSRCDMTLVDGEVFFQRRDTFGLDKTSVRSEVPTASTAKLPPIPASVTEIAIVGGTVYPVSGPQIDGGTVILRDGKIAEVGKNIDVPASAHKVDATGLRVYPGFIDAESQLARQEIDSVRATLDTTEIGRFQPDLVALTSVNPESEHIAITRLGGVTTALTRPLGPPIAGQGSLIDLDGWTTEQMGVVPNAALYINFPAGVESLPDWLLEGLTPEDRKRREDFAKEQRRRLRDYLEMAKRYLIARKDPATLTPTDTRLEALAPYLTGGQPVVIAASTAASIREAVKLADDLKLKMVLSGGKEAWRVAKLLADKKIPVILQPSAVSSLGAGGNTSSREYDPWDAFLSQPALLHRAGVTIAFGSGESSNAYELPSRAGLACAYGLPQDAAIKALTINAAQIFGVADRLGTLERGKVANVVVYDGDPMETTTHVQALFIRGRPIPLESKWTRLYEKYLQRTP